MSPLNNIGGSTNQPISQYSATNIENFLKEIDKLKIEIYFCMLGTQGAEELKQDIISLHAQQNNIHVQEKKPLDDSTYSKLSAIRTELKPKVSKYNELIDLGIQYFPKYKEKVEQLINAGSALEKTAEVNANLDELHQCKLALEGNLTIFHEQSTTINIQNLLLEAQSLKLTSEFFEERYKVFLEILKFISSKEALKDLKSGVTESTSRIPALLNQQELFICNIRKEVTSFRVLIKELHNEKKYPAEYLKKYQEENGIDVKDKNSLVTTLQSFAEQLLGFLKNFGTIYDQAKMKIPEETTANNLV